MGFGLD